MEDLVRFGIWTQEDLERAVKRADEAKQKFINALTVGNSYAVVSGLSWAGELAELNVTASRAAEILADMHPSETSSEEKRNRTLEEVLEYHVNRIAEELIGDYHGGHSTSDFSNAVEGATRRALGHLHSNLKSALNHLRRMTREIQEGEA
jgi:hypothetical protein